MSDDEPIPFVPWALRYAEMARLRDELGAAGLVSAFKCAMHEYDPDANVNVSITRARRAKKGGGA